MAVAAHHDENRQHSEPEPPDQLQGRSFSSWWYVWIPVIIAVTLWIGGWWFGNYGGPWAPKPQSTQPQISDPAAAPFASFPTTTTGSRLSVGPSGKVAMRQCGIERTLLLRAPIRSRVRALSLAVIFPFPVDADRSWLAQYERGAYPQKGVRRSKS
jgi:hypothetical protein